MLYDLESHAKDGRCGLSRNEDIRRFEGKLIEKQTLVHFAIALNISIKRYLMTKTDHNTKILITIKLLL